MKTIHTIDKDADYITYYSTTAEYNAAKSKFLEPNVSFTNDDEVVHYLKSTKVIAKYNVTSTSSSTKIGYNQYTSAFTEIEIDGVVRPIVVSAYTFNTLGEHTVKYTLKDPTSIGQYAFWNCSGLTSIIIPSGVTSIGNEAFASCSGLTSMTVDSSNTVYDSRDNCNAIIKTATNTLIQGCKSTIIPNSVTSIGNSAFTQCISYKYNNSR